MTAGHHGPFGPFVYEAGAAAPAVPFAQRLRQAKASPVRPSETPAAARAVAAAARAPANAEFVFA